MSPLVILEALLISVNSNSSELVEVFFRKAQDVIGNPSASSLEVCDTVLEPVSAVELHNEGGSVAAEQPLLGLLETLGRLLVGNRPVGFLGSGHAQDGSEHFLLRKTERGHIDELVLIIRQAGAPRRLGLDG